MTEEQGTELITAVEAIADRCETFVPALQAYTGLLVAIMFVTAVAAIAALWRAVKA